MKKLTRLALIGGTAVGALALAGPALAAYTPKLDVSLPNSLGASATTKIHFAVGATDDGTAKITMYSPIRFQISPTPAPGTELGTVTAGVRAADLAGAIVPVTGTLRNAPPSGTVLVGGVPVPIATIATACTGTATHTAFWVAKLSAAGQSLELAMFFDTTSGAETALGSSKLQFCLPPDDVPAGTPGRSPLGIKLIDAVIALKNVFTNATTAGAYIWTSIWTPYTPGAGTANAAGTVTAISVTPIPVALTLKGTYDKKKKQAKLSGRITLAGQFTAGAKLPLFSGATAKSLKRTGSTGATKASGAFTAIKRIVKTTFFQVRLAVPAVDFTQQGCAALPTTLPKCVSASIGPFTVLSKIVKVTVPKK